MLWDMWWASKLNGEWGRERGRWGNWDRDSEPVQHNKTYEGKYRNTGLVIQFMFIYIASVIIKIVPRHSTENKGQASNILASDVITECGESLRVLITHIHW